MSSAIKASHAKAGATVARTVVGVVRPQSGLTRTAESAMEQQAQALARASRHHADGANQGAKHAAGGRVAAPVAHFAAQHGYDLGRIRIHTDAYAATLADDVQARALTLGHDIYFARGEYAPSTAQGRELIAHEQIHAVQQSLPAVGPRLQCACRPLSPPFDLTGSQIGQAIHAALSAVKVFIPGATPGAPGREVPRVNPNQVLQLLAVSPCFQRDADAVERTFCGGQGGCGTRLNLDFHHDSSKGSEYVPGPSGQPATLRVEVTTLPAVIRRIVHEIAHAVPGRQRGTWPAAVTQGWGSGGGAVTRHVRGRLREESRTRQRENEVMREIQAHATWRRLVGSTRVPAAQYQPQQVRTSLVSGTPRLTYEEHFIVEAMQARYRVTGVDIDRARQVARDMVGTGMVDTVERTQLRDYIITNVAIERYRGLAAGEHAAGPITVYGSQIQGESPRVLTERMARYFVRWFDALPAALTQRCPARRSRVRRCLTARGARAMRLFAWLLVAEQMGREWQRLTGGGNASAADINRLRRNHLQFLIGAAGGRRAGVLSGERGLLSGTAVPPASGETP